MLVNCLIEEITIDYVMPAVRAICSKCNEESVSAGTHERSIRRCLVLLKEKCPLGEQNYYQQSDIKTFQKSKTIFAGRKKDSVAESYIAEKRTDPLYRCQYCDRDSPASEWRYNVICPHCERSYKAEG